MDSNTNEVIEQNSISPFSQVVEIKNEICDDPVTIDKVDDFDFEPFHENIFRTLSTNFDNEKTITEVNNAFANLENCFLENNILNKNGISKFSLKTSNNSSIFLKYRDIDDAFIDMVIPDSNIKRTVLNQNLKKIDLKPFNETYFSINDNETTFSDDGLSKNGSDSEGNEECDSYFGESLSEDEISDCDDSIDNELVDDRNTLFGKEVRPEPVSANLINNCDLRSVSKQCETDDLKVENHTLDKVRDIRVVVEKLTPEPSEIVQVKQENDNVYLSYKSSLEARRQVARKKTGGMVINTDVNRDSSFYNKEQKVNGQLCSKDGDFVPNVFDKMTRAGKRDLERVLAESTANLVIQKTTQLISEKIKELQTQDENNSENSSSSEDEAKESGIHKTAEIVTNTIIEFLTKSKSKKLDKIEKEITEEINNKVNSLRSDFDGDTLPRALSESLTDGSPLDFFSEPKLVDDCRNNEVREARANLQKRKNTEKKVSSKMSADSREELARIEKEIINYMEGASHSVEKESKEEYVEPPRRPETRQSKLKQQLMLKNDLENASQTTEIRQVSRRRQRTVRKSSERRNTVKVTSPDSISIDPFTDSTHSSSQLKENETCDQINSDECKEMSDSTVGESVSSNQTIINTSSPLMNKPLKASADSTTTETALPIIESETFENNNFKEGTHSIPKQNNVDGKHKETDIGIDSVTSNFQEDELLLGEVTNSISCAKPDTNFNKALTIDTEDSSKNFQNSEIEQKDGANLYETKRSKSSKVNIELNCTTNTTYKIKDAESNAEPKSTSRNLRSKSSKLTERNSEITKVNSSKQQSREVKELDLKVEKEPKMCGEDKDNLKTDDEDSLSSSNNVLIKEMGKIESNSELPGAKEHSDENLSLVCDNFPKSITVDTSENNTSFLNYTLDDSFKLTIDEDTPVGKQIESYPELLNKPKDDKMNLEEIKPTINNRSSTVGNTTKKNLEEGSQEIRSVDSKSKDTLGDRTEEINNLQSSTKLNTTTLSKSILKSSKEEHNCTSECKTTIFKPLTNEEKIAQLTKRDPRLIPHEKKVVSALIRDPRIRNKLPKKEEVQEKPHQEILDSPLSPDCATDSGTSSGQLKIDDNNTNIHQNTSKLELSESIDSRKKKFKKAVDEELLYKTPLSDLHESSGDRPSYERLGMKKKPPPPSRLLKRERELCSDKPVAQNRNRLTEDIKEMRGHFDHDVTPEDNVPDRYFHRETFSERNSLLPKPDETSYRPELRNPRLRYIEERPHPNDIKPDYQSGSRENFDQETYARRSRPEGNYSHERECSDGQFYSRREFYRRNKFSHDHDHFSNSRFIERRQENQFYSQDNFCADSVSAFPPISLLPDPMYNNQEGEFDQTYGNMETDSFSPPDLCPPPPPLIRSPPLDRERRDEYCPSPPRIGRSSPEGRDFADFRGSHRNYERDQRNFTGRSHFSQDSSNYAHRNTQVRRGNGRDRWNENSPPRKRFISEYARGHEDERSRWRRSPSWSPDRERIRHWSRERSLTPPMPSEAQPWDSPPNQTPPRWHDNYRDRINRNENFQRYY